MSPQTSSYFKDLVPFGLCEIIFCSVFVTERFLKLPIDGHHVVYTLRKKCVFFFSNVKPHVVMIVLKTANKNGRNEFIGHYYILYIIFYIFCTVKYLVH